MFLVDIITGDLDDYDPEEDPDYSPSEDEETSMY